MRKISYLEKLFKRLGVVELTHRLLGGSNQVAGLWTAKNPMNGNLLQLDVNYQGTIFAHRCVEEDGELFRWASLPRAIKWLHEFDLDGRLYGPFYGKLQLTEYPYHWWCSLNRDGQWLSMSTSRQKELISRVICAAREDEFRPLTDWIEETLTDACAAFA